MNSTKAVFGRILGASGVIARLDNFDAAPAIFNDRAPDDFQFGAKFALIIAAPSSDTDASTLSETVRAIVQDVRIYGRDTGSTADLDQLARDIRDLFHLQPDALSVDGGTCNIATATGPVSSPTTDPSLVGRRITVRLELQRN